MCNNTLQRNVRFLVTADPQIGIAGGDHTAIQTLRTMVLLKLEDPSISGIIIAGDLTQSTQRSQYNRYLYCASNPHKLVTSFIYDGLGNHDLYTKSFWEKLDPLELFGDYPEPDYIKNEIKKRERESKPFLRSGIHYAWKWNDIVFLQLNLFPGNTKGEFGDYSPEDSLCFLRKTLNKIPSNNYVVLIHHYGFDDFSIGNSSQHEIWWTEEQRKEYWDTIAPYEKQIYGIFTGHVHYEPTENPQCNFNKPLGCTRGPAFFPAFVAGACCQGAYVDVRITDTQMVVKRMSYAGPTNVPDIIVDLPEKQSMPIRF